MSYFIAIIYALSVSFCTWRMWQGDKSHALIAQFLVSVLFMLNAIHWGFIFSNEDEGALTSFGAALRFSFGEMPQDPTFEMLVQYCVIRLICILGFGYTAFFVWQKRAALQENLKKQELQKPLMAGAVFLSFSLMGILTGAVFVHMLAALSWGAFIYLWPKAAQ